MAKRLTLGFFVEQFAERAKGGAEESARLAAHHLALVGHKVYVFVPYRPPVIRYGNTFVAPIWDFRRLIARGIRFDVLHAHTNKMVVPVLRRARRYGIPCVGTVRDMSARCGFCNPFSECGSCGSFFSLRCFLDYVKRYRRSLIKTAVVCFVNTIDGFRRRSALKKYDRVVYPSDALRRLVGIPGDVIPNPAPEAVNIVRSIDRRPVHVLFLGKMSLGKGFHHYCKVVRRLGHRKDIQFWAAGRTAPEMPIQTFPDDLHYLGVLDREQVRRLLIQTDLIVFPSICHEAAGRAILEGAACAVPTIITDRGGAKEYVVPWETGWIVPADDVNALESLLATLVKEPWRITVAGRKAQEFVSSQFDSRAIALEHYQLYRSLLATWEFATATQ